MNRITVILGVLVVFCLPVHAQDRSTGQRIEDILKLPEDQIDLGHACLVLAQDAYPNLNIQTFDTILDVMASQLHRLMQGVTDPEARIAMMNTYLYRPGWWNDSLTFDYDLEDLEANKKDNQFLNGYLATRKGSCITMPMLHLVLADRLDWPMSAVRSPKHFFLRYVAKGYKEVNIEATSYGGYIPDAHYIAMAGIPDKAVRNGVYLRTLTQKEYLASLLLTIARHFHEREHNLRKAIYSLGLALSIDPTLASAHWNVAHYYSMMAEQLDREFRAQSGASRVVYETGLQALQRRQTLFRKGSARSLSRPPEPEAGLLPPGMAFPSLVPSAPSVPVPNFLPTDPALVIIQQEYQAEQQQLQSRYLPHIQEALGRAEWHHQKAKELGIVLMSPTTLYRRQDELIERSRSRKTR